MTQEAYDKILSLIDEGKTTKEISAETGWTGTWVREIAKREGRKIKKRKRLYLTSHFLSAWDELNKDNFIHDCPIMYVEALAERYRINKCTVHAYAKKFGVQIKQKPGCSLAKLETKVVFSAPDMTDACAYNYPNHQHLRIARV